MPLHLSDPVCLAQVEAFMAQASHVRWSEDAARPRETLFVVANGAMLREGPSRSAPVLQKLGYGVEVAVVAPGCAEGWTLVASPYGSIEHGVGFIKDELVARSLLTEVEVEGLRKRATEPVAAAAWAMIEALYFPSPAHAEAAREAAVLARSTLTEHDVRPCDVLFGTCEVLARHNDEGTVPVPGTIGEISVGPWWTLSSATGAAELAVFRAAYVQSTVGRVYPGHDCCGTQLDVALEPLGGSAAVSRAASRRPPAFWLIPIPDAPCVGAENTARTSALWEVPLSQSDFRLGMPALPDAGYCVPGEDGSAWWVQPWDVETTDWPTYRSYRVWPGRGVTARVDDRALALRDLDGDGDVETLWECSLLWGCGSTSHLRWTGRVDGGGLR